MKIEHCALQVAEPAAMAEWYVRHMGMAVKRASDVPVVVRFLSDDSGAVMLEIYRNFAAPLPDYAAMDPLVLHVAWMSDDVAGDRVRLMKAGATAVGDVQALASGDTVAMLRDPWGVPLQLVRRADPMV